MPSLDASHIEKQVEAKENLAEHQDDLTISLQEALKIYPHSKIDTFPKDSDKHGPYASLLDKEISATLVAYKNDTPDVDNREISEEALRAPRAVAEIGGEALSIDVDGNEFFISLKKLPGRSGGQLVISMEVDGEMRSYHLVKGKPTIGGFMKFLGKVTGKISKEDKEILDNGADIQNIAQFNQWDDTTYTSIPLLSDGVSDTLQAGEEITISFAMLSKIFEKDIFLHNKDEHILECEFDDFPFDEALQKLVWYKVLTHNKMIKELYNELQGLQSERKYNMKRIQEIQEQLKELSATTKKDIEDNAVSTLKRVKGVHLVFRKVKEPTTDDH